MIADDLRHTLRVIHHRHVPAVSKGKHAGMRGALLRALGLPGEEHAILGAPGDRDGNVGGDVGVKGVGLFEQSAQGRKCPDETAEVIDRLVHRQPLAAFELAGTIG